ELSRAAYHRILSEFNVLLTLPSNMPSGYHRDLQLTKEAVMRATLRSLDLFRAMTNVLQGIAFDRDRLAEMISPELFATHEALRRVAGGTPFRDAYREAAAAVDTLQTPPDEEALAGYIVDGYPGRCRPDIIRQRVEKYRV
ncbi:MAG: argininosuccinate lyase, partial [Bacteroidota bacterium]